MTADGTFVQTQIERDLPSFSPVSNFSADSRSTEVHLTFLAYSSVPLSTAIAQKKAARRKE